MSVQGIHHVTAIAGDAQRTVDFYAGVLGMRLVKRTVNFDDPATMHLYFGDERGAPGSVLTFFVWPGAKPGRPGHGQVNFTAFAIAPESLGYWLTRLATLGFRHEPVTRRFDEQVIALQDRDGLRLELVASPSAADRTGWGGGDVPAEHAIRGVHAVTLWVEDAAATAAVLTGPLGFRAAGATEGTARFESGGGGSGTFVDVRATPAFWKGATGVGVVHHVAFRVPDGAAQEALAATVAQAGLQPTSQLDRRYFTSVYFREPGGTLFEVATDGPGFTRDEPLASLGSALALPPWLEPRRGAIAAALPDVHLPTRLTAENSSFASDRS